MSRGAIALAGVPGLRRAARRTTALRLVLLAGACALLAAAYLASRGAGSELGALLPSGTSPIVALDLSASISGPTSRRVLATLQTLAGSAGTAGLVVFSDTGYEMLPPGSPTRELRPLMRFFEPNGTSSGIETFPKNPWSDTFQAGTRISAGLDEARLALARAGIHNGTVILVSDLEDPETASLLTTSLARLRQAGIALRIVPLFPLPENLALWESLVGKDAIAASPSLPVDPAAARRQEEHPFRPGVASWLLVLCSLLVLVLAANERLCGRLPVERRRGEA